MKFDRIIIAGDSWGAGEWTDTGFVVHRGLEEYARQDGNLVWNISKARESVNQLMPKLQGAQLDNDLLVIFLTEFFRDNLEWDDDIKLTPEEFLAKRTRVKDNFLSFL